MMQTPAQAGNRASKPEHYQAVAGTQLRMGSNLASVATNEHTHPCIFCCFLLLFRKRTKQCLHFSIGACHPCAGAMLIFSVSFQF